jgi:hypothetical protein
MMMKPVAVAMLSYESLQAHTRYTAMCIMYTHTHTRKCKRIYKR